MPMIQIANSTDLCIVASPEVLRFMSTMGEDAAIALFIHKAELAPKVGEGEQGEFTFRASVETRYLINYVQTGKTRMLLDVEQIHVEKPEMNKTPDDGHQGYGKGWNIAKTYYALGITGFITSFGIFVAKNAAAWAPYIPFLR